MKQIYECAFCEEESIVDIHGTEDFNCPECGAPAFCMPGCHLKTPAPSPEVLRFIP